MKSIFALPVSSGWAKIAISVWHTVCIQFFLFFSPTFFLVVTACDRLFFFFYHICYRTCFPSLLDKYFFFKHTLPWHISRGALIFWSWLFSGHLKLEGVATANNCLQTKKQNLIWLKWMISSLSKTLFKVNGFFWGSVVYGLGNT